ncbi:MAG: cell division protein FtsZ, partial [Christensenella sp.]
TKPFAFEGKRKMTMAEIGISGLLERVDALIVIPNERLKYISQEKITLANAFEAADNVLRQGVESISALINVAAFINLDFADVRSIMKDAGYAHMGVGSAKGVNKAEDAANAAISSPLLETSIAGARGVIINITSSPDIGLDDVEKAATLITNSAHPDANIIWGAAFDDSLKDEMRITVVATGFDIVDGVSTVAPVAMEYDSRTNAPYGGGNTAVRQPAPVASVQPVPVEAFPAPVASTQYANAREEEEKDAEDIDALMRLLNNRGRYNRHDGRCAERHSAFFA